MTNARWEGEDGADVLIEQGIGEEFDAGAFGECGGDGVVVVKGRAFC